MKPMLAVEAVDDKIRFPVWASVKIDGVRGLIKDGVAYSRSLKPLPNQFLQQWVANHAKQLEGMDGEFVVGPANDSNVMQTTMSGVMRKDGEPDFTFQVFDLWNEETTPYTDRYRMLRMYVDRVRSHTNRVVDLLQMAANSKKELDEIEDKALRDGYEGLMIRDPKALYKFGRSTVKEGALLKVKRFVDAEARVIGVEEQMHNANTAEVNELGRTKRSTAKSGLVPAGVLGALVVRDLVSGVEFSIGTGFTAEQRSELWKLSKGQHLIGRSAKYKSFQATGVKEAPRFPVFLGWRDEIDLNAGE